MKHPLAKKAEEYLFEGHTKAVNKDEVSCIRSHTHSGPSPTMFG